MLEDCGMQCSEAIVIWCDNQSAIEIAKNPTHHGRTKHIDIRFHFIRGLVAEGVIVLRYCKTEDQKADIMTKALPVKKHVYLRSLIGVSEFTSKGECCELLVNESELVDWSAEKGWLGKKDGLLLTCQTAKEPIGIRKEILHSADKELMKM